MIEHYKVLPTDERYKALTDEVKQILFANWLHSPEDDDMKREFWRAKTAEEQALKLEDLIELGYDEESARKVLEDVNV